MHSEATPTVLLTRSAEDNTLIAPVFHAAGLATVLLPAIVIAEPEDWTPVDDAIADLASFDGVFFTSRNAVRMFLRRLDEKLPDGRSAIRSLMVAAVGAKTEEALEDEDVRVDVVPEIGAAENLLASLDEMDLTGKRYLFPKSSIARDVLPTELRDRGAQVDEIVVYRTVPPDAGNLDAIRNGLVEGSIQCAAFFSPSAVRNVVQLLGSLCMQETVIAAIGMTTAGAARAMGLTVGIVAEAPDSDGLAAAIAAFFKQDTPSPTTRNER